jgi:outer membrane receptor protein involved in Fe transport
MRSIRFTVGVLAALALAMAPQIASAQSALVTGEILGTVFDPDAAVMPGTTISIANAETGFNRSTVTDASGFFRFSLVPTGTYDVRADLAGFKSEIKRGITVSLGSAVKIDFTLALTAVEEEIVVTADAPVVEVSNPSVASSVNDEQIANLPLEGRDFKDLAILVPGSVISDDSKQNNRGGLTMGARAIQNSFNIDGTNSQSSFFGEERGGTRPAFTFSQAAIKEFQVIKSSYNLQFTSTGGVINAITKSGTNSFHGEVFGYYSDDSMRGTDADGNEATSYERMQYGFALGGPIVRDKLHFFGSLDAQDYTTPYYADNWDTLSPAEVVQFNQITGLDYTNEIGQIDMTNDSTVFLIKADWQIVSNHLFAVRYNWHETEGLNGLYSNPFPSTFRSLNSTEGNNFDSLVGNLNSVLSDNAFNEAIIQYSAERRPRTPNTTLIPETAIYGYRATFGQKSYLPNKLDEDRLQIIDNFTYYMGNHTLKAGINFDFVHYDNVFLYYGNGYYTFSDWDDFFDADAGNYRQAFSASDGAIVFDVDYYSFYLQDEWRASPNLTLTYGLRYDLQDNPTPDMSNPGYPDTASIPDDTNNWSPRVGFAWDINGDGKSVLRGGAGYFYDNIPTLTLSNAMNDNGVRTLTLYQRCYAGDECPTYPDTWSGPGDLEGGGSPSIKVVSPDFQNPETKRVSLGYEREILRDFSLGADFIYYETKYLARSQDQNVTATDELTVDGLTMYDYGEAYPDFNEINQYTSDVPAEYTAIVLKARKRFSSNWAFDASYTWSDAKDSDSNERATTSYPFDQYDLSQSWGPSDFDHTHKFVLSGVWQLPYNFLISGIAYYRSGFPYTAYSEGWDSNGDGQDENEQALIQNSDGSYFRYERNTFRQPNYKKLDLRLSWTANFGRDFSLELIFDVFNVTNSDNWYTTNRALNDWEWDGSDYEMNDNFGELNGWGDPRTYQIGARFSF